MMARYFSCKTKGASGASWLCRGLPSVTATYSREKKGSAMPTGGGGWDQDEVQVKEFRES